MNDDLYYAIALAIDDPNAFVSFCYTNRSTYQVCSSKHLWKYKFEQENIPFPSLINYNTMDEWLTLFHIGKDVASIYNTFMNPMYNGVDFEKCSTFAKKKGTILVHAIGTFHVSENRINLTLLFHDLHNHNVSIYKNALLYPYPVLIKNTIDLNGIIGTLRIRKGDIYNTYNIYMTVHTLNKVIKYQFELQNDLFIWFIYYLFIHQIVVY